MRDRKGNRPQSGSGRTPGRRPDRFDKPSRNNARDNNFRDAGRGRDDLRRDSFRREDSAHREEQVISAVFGVLPVLEALRSEPRKIERILIAEEAREHRFADITKQAKEHRLLIEFVPREKLDRAVEQGVNHQGIIAFKAAADYARVDQIFDSAPEMPLYLLLDGIEDPRNFGAILRTAECAGVDGVFIPERRAVGLTATVAKTAAGATEHIKIAKTTNMNRLIDDLKSKNVWVVGTDSNAKMSYADWDWNQPSALVLGAEGKGLHRLVAENCDVLVNIPMQGKIESLNVSVAAGVVLFEALRQRKGGKS